MRGFGLGRHGSLESNIQNVEVCKNKCIQKILPKRGKHKGTSEGGR